MDDWENFPNFTLNYSMLSKGKCSKGRSNYLSNYSPALKKWGGILNLGCLTVRPPVIIFFISA